MQLSAIYVTLVFINLLIFWFVTGANQVRLISEKAGFLAESVGNEILRRFDGMLLQVGRFNITDEAAFASRFAESLKIKSSEAKLILDNFRIVNANGRIILSVPKVSEEKLSPEEGLNIFRALQMKQLNQRPYYPVPDVFSYSLRLYLPLIDAGDRHLILIHDMPIESLRTEFFALVRIAAGMVMILLAAQVLFGYILYKRFLGPVVAVGKTAEELAAGNLGAVVSSAPGNNEISAMINSFNFMSSEIRIKTEALRKAYTELREKDHRSEYELEIAQKIQESIIPKAQDLSHIKAASIYRPLYTVSGDYFDMIPLTDGSVGIFMADASGHGVPAAFLTMFAKVFFTSLVEKIRDPAELLREINRCLSQFLEGNGLYLTAFYIRIYPNGHAELCNCMHPNPIVCRRDGSFTDFESFGFFLGLMPEAAMPFETRHHQFESGDKLVLYTDGITEAENTAKQMYGTERLKNLVVPHRGLSPQALAGKIYQDVTEYQAGAAFNDDVTVLVLEYQKPQPSAESAMALYNRKSYSEAAAAFSELMTPATRESRRWNYLLADSLLKSGDFPAALAHLTQTRAYNEDDPRHHYLTGVCLLKMDQLAGAEAALGRACDISPEMSAAWSKRALAALRQGEKARASNFIIKALEIDPTNIRYAQLHEKIRAETVSH